MGKALTLQIAFARELHLGVKPSSGRPVAAIGD